MTIYNVAIDSDDGYEVMSTGACTVTGDSVVQCESTTGDYRVPAIRLQLTGVNQGDSIFTGTLYCYMSPSSRDDIHCDVTGELVTSPATFSATTNHITNRLSANPTSTTVEWNSTGTGAGWYSVDVSSVIQELVNQASWPNDGYIVLFLDPQPYSDSKHAFIASYNDATNPWYLDLTSGPANDAPTIALNTADSSSLSTTPTLEFTGSDTDGDDLRYQIQITDNPNTFTGGSVETDALESGAGTIIHPQPAGGTTWEGKNQIDDRFGFSFQADGGILDSISFYFGTDQVGDTDGTYLCRVYAASGVGVNPVPDAWAASTAYSVDDIVRPTSSANADVHLLYKCKVAGTSGGTEPSWPGNGVLWTSVSEGTETTDNTVTWEVVYPSYPTSPASPANTPTPGWLAESTTYAYNPGTTDVTWKTCAFTGTDRIRLTPGGWYIAILDWWPNDTVTTNVLAIRSANFADATTVGCVYLDGSSTNNNGPRIIGDAYYRVNESFTLLDKVSGTDAGFANTVTPADTDPFNAGEKISFTVQGADELDSAIDYRWQVRCIDPSGTNLWISYSTPRTFTTLTGYTMTGANGSFTFTGRVSNLLRDALLSLAAGSDTFSGFTTNLVASRLVSGQSGTFSFTGFDVSLLRGLLTAIESGSFTFTGFDAPVIWGHFISAGSGSFTFTGRDLLFSLLTGYTLTAATGSFTFTGFDIPVIAGLIFHHDGGDFTFGGSNTNLLAGRLIQPASGSFTFTGRDLIFSLIIAYLISMERGSFSQTGFDTSILVDRILVPGSADLPFTGMTMNLLRSSFLGFGAGSFGFTGRSAGVQVQRLLSASAGSNVFSGFDTNLIANLLLLGASGSFNFSGSNISILFDSQAYQTMTGRPIILTLEPRS